MGVHPCPQNLSHFLFWLAYWSCHTGIATSRWLRCWPSTVFHDHCCLWQCPWACALLQVKPPLWQWAEVFRAQPALVGLWHEIARLGKGILRGRAHRQYGPNTRLSTSEQTLLRVLFVFGRYPALKQLFWQTGPVCNYFLSRSFAKFSFCYPRSSTLLQAS